MSSDAFVISDIAHSVLEDAYINLFVQEEVREVVESVADFLCQKYLNNTTPVEGDFVVVDGRPYDVMLTGRNRENDFEKSDLEKCSKSHPSPSHLSHISLFHYHLLIGSGLRRLLCPSWFWANRMSFASYYILSSIKTISPFGTVYFSFIENNFIFCVKLLKYYLVKIYSFFMYCNYIQLFPHLLTHILPLKIKIVSLKSLDTFLTISIK